MSTQLQLRRDTTANVGAITPAQGEPIYDVTRKALVLGDGATAGGNCVTPFSGTWTPQLNFGGANVGMTFSANVGSWQVIGNLCFAFFDFTLSAKGSSTGNATITALPFNAVGADPHGGIQMFYYGPLASGFTGFPHGYVDIVDFTIDLVKSGAASSAFMSDADFINTSQLTGVAIYRIAQPTA